MNRASAPTPPRQRGYVLLAMLAVLVMGSLYAFVARLDGATRARDEATMRALAQAKEALLGYAATYRDLREPNAVFGYLPCPDTAQKGGIYRPGDGAAAGNGHCGGEAEYAIGLLPYRTLALADLRDAAGNCLWYAVSNTFKNNQGQAPLNWDTPGQLSVEDDAGAVLAAPDDAFGGAAAVILAPGAALPGQSRTALDQPCGADPAQLAAYLENNAAVLRRGPRVDGNGNVVGNDRIAWIAPREIFDRVTRRADFSNPLTASPPGQINKLADEMRAALEQRMQDDLVAGGAPAASLPANAAGYAQFPGKTVGEAPAILALRDAAYAGYYAHWRDQFRHVACASLDNPCLTLGSAATNCRGALLFGGRSTSGQPRAAAQKTASTANLAHYFEPGSGLDLLAGAATVFAGHTAYAAASPAADVATCLFPGAFVSFARDIAAFAAGVVTPAGGGQPVAAVRVAGTPAIDLGSATPNARSGCVWYPAPLPLGASLRLYYRYRIDAAATGASARGYALALADAASNDPRGAASPMCGAAGNATLGYAGGNVGGMASVGASSVAIAAANWSAASGRATIVTTANHGFRIGDTVAIAGASAAGYNGSHTILSSGFGAAQFRVAVADPGTPAAGIAPPKIGVEFDSQTDAAANDPAAEHVAFLYWGTAADNDFAPAPAATARDGADDNRHASGIVGDGSQPQNPRSLSTTSATVSAVANIAAARWAGGTATITTTAPHGFAPGQTIDITDLGALGYKGRHTITAVPAPDGFEFALAADPGRYPYVATVAAASWAGGTATIVTAAAHGLAAGQTIDVANMAPAAWNGRHTITAADADHLSFTLAADPDAYAAGGAISDAVGSIVAATWSDGRATLTTAAPHGLVNHQFATIAATTPAAFGGSHRIEVIDATHFSYALAANPGAYVVGGQVVATATTSSVTRAPTPAVATIANAAWSAADGGSARLATAADHGLSDGQRVVVAGIAPAGYNGAFAVTVTDASHFGYALAADPGGSFDASAFAAPGIATVKASDRYLPHAAMPADTDIHVRIDVARAYAAARHQATLTLRAYVGDTFAAAGNCVLADFRNLASDLAALCPARAPTIAQDGIVIDDVAGPALANIYLGFTTARGAAAGDNQAVAISDLLVRSQ